MTDTPARPALDEGDEPTPEAILIAAWKLRFNKAFRPEEEAGALMAFLDTVGLCVVSKRALADMRGALEKIESMQPVAFSFPADWSAQIAGCSECQRYKKHPIQQGICDTHRKPLYERERHEQHERETMRFRMKDVAREALARSAP